MAKIYTKTGDDGNTSLANGKRLSKSSLRICAFGEIDELNALLGVCRHSCGDNKFLAGIFNRLQNDLFVLGTERIKSADTGNLEKNIDLISAKLKPLRNFILPGGCEEAAFLHLARTVCRRAERAVVLLQKKEKISPETIKYLNRLGDLLFVMARYANKLERKSEIKWAGKI
jgi:cob(I)alamin adenosyltransferase